MATPITWRNINSDPTLGASRALSGAQQSVQDVSKSLMGIIDSGNQLQADNRAAMIKGNTQNFLDQVAGKSATDLADPAVQAQLAAQRQSMASAGLIDQAATRNATVDQGALLQKAAMQTMEFNDKSQTVSDRPAEQQVAQLVANKDFTGAKQLIDQNHFLNAPSLYDSLTQAQRAATGDAYKAQDQVWQGQNHALSMAQGNQSMDFARRNQAYADTVHAQGIKEINDSNAADAVVRQLDEAYSTGQKQQATAVNAIADKLQLPRDPTTGEIAYDKLSNDQAQTIKDTLKAQGLDQNYSATSRNATAHELTKDLPVAIQKQVQDKASILDAFDAVAPADQPRMQSYVQQATKQATSDLTMLQIQEEKDKRNNVWLNTSADPEKDAMGIVDGFISKQKDRPTDANQRKLIEGATNALRSGIKVNIDGEDKLVQVPPSMLANALDAVGYDQAASMLSYGSFKPDEIGNYIKDQLVNNPDMLAQMKAAPQLAGAYAKGKIQLSRKIEADTTDAVNTFKQQNGITPNSSSIIDRINRAAKESKQ
jgi:hypothetical protein